MMFCLFVCLFGLACEFSALHCFDQFQMAISHEIHDVSQFSEVARPVTAVCIYWNRGAISIVVSIDVPRAIMGD